MTPAEYFQLKAFARVDGALLSVLWVVSFACYVAGMSGGGYGLLAVLLVFYTPFFVRRRLRLFRDEALTGTLSFGRGYGFVLLTFFYASILFAVAQYVYFAFIDSGYLLQMMVQLMESPEGQQLALGYGLGTEEVTKALEELGSLRPIDIALDIATFNITAGIVLGVPISLATRRHGKSEKVTKQT